MGHNRWTTFGVKLQAADAHIVLASVAKLADAGNRVVFDKDEGYIERTKTGKGLS